MSTKRFLTIFFVSISIYHLISCSSSEKARVCCDKKVFSVLTPVDSVSTRYRALIQYDSIQITGILILKQSHDTLRALFMNEFGFNAFDMEMGFQFAEIHSNLEALNKWYIRKQLKEDLHFMLMPVCECANNKEFVNLKTIFGEYSYTVESYGFSATKTKNNNKIAVMKIYSEGSIEMQNLTRNISYKLTILAQTN